MEYTQYFNLAKPSMEDNAEISVLNDNMDIIDEILNQEGSGVQADWSTNNDSEASYIKNRPFYEKIETFENTVLDIANAYKTQDKVYTFKNLFNVPQIGNYYNIEVDISGYDTITLENIEVVDGTSYIGISNTPMITCELPDNLGSCLCLFGVSVSGVAYEDAGAIILDCTESPEINKVTILNLSQTLETVYEVSGKFIEGMGYVTKKQYDAYSFNIESDAENIIPLYDFTPDLSNLISKTVTAEMTNINTSEKIELSGVVELIDQFGFSAYMIDFYDSSEQNLFEIICNIDVYTMSYQQVDYSCIMADDISLLMGYDIVLNIPYIEKIYSKINENLYNNVKPNYNEEEADSLDYIANRPFFETNFQVDGKEPTPDPWGNAEELIIYTYNYKLFTEADVNKTYKIRLFYNEEGQIRYGVEYIDCDLSVLDDALPIIVGAILDENSKEVAYIYDGAEYFGTFMPAPQKSMLIFSKDSEILPYIDYFKYIKKIDEKYLPDWVLALKPNP